MYISLSAFAPENLVSRDGFGSSVPRQPAHLHTQADSGAYLRDSSRVPRRRSFIYLTLYTIGSVPSLSGRAISYRWRSLPIVRRYRASKPQGSSKRVLPWKVTTNQLIFASLSHIDDWYEVDMLKVQRMHQRRTSETGCMACSSAVFGDRHTGRRSGIVHTVGHVCTRARSSSGVVSSTTQLARYAREIDHRPGSCPEAAQRSIHDGRTKRFGVPEESGLGKYFMYVYMYVWSSNIAEYRPIG